jgi:gluconate 5-dehydrogenase
MHQPKNENGIQPPFDLTGRVAIVTGAAGALGRSVSKGLAIHGANTVLCDIAEKELGPLADKIRATGRKALPVFCDVTNPASVDRMVKEARKAMGNIHILFNGAGIAHRAPLLEMDMAAWQNVMDINVKGTLLCCRAVAEEMIRQGEGGSMITVGSVRGYNAHEGGYSAYGTSKAAVHYITKQLAFEWAPHNIRVNGIAPCVFRSALTEPILSDADSYRQYTARIPLGRVAEPEDFIGPTIFLASQASAMVTAHMLAVDGGTLGG